MEEEQPLVNGSSSDISQNLLDKDYARKIHGLQTSDTSVSNTTTKPKSNWRKTILCVNIFGLLNTTISTVTLPSMFPYVLKKDGDYIYYGIVASSFMIGTVVFSPLITFWANKRPSREVLFVSTILCLAGGIIYGLGYNIWMLIFGRFLSGVGIGSVSVGRVIITRTTTSKERPAAFGSLSLAQCGGYVLGPTIAFGCGFLREDYNIYFKNSFIMNSLSIPGYVTAFLCFIYLIILVFAFREPPTWNRESSIRASDLSVVGMQKYYPRYPIALFACYFIHFMIGFAVSGLEVTIVPITSNYLSWNVAKNSLIFVGIGFLVTVSVFIQRMMSLKLEVRNLVVVGMVVMALGFGALLEYTKFFPAQYLVGVALFTIGNTIAWTSNLPLFAKLLRGNLQGAAMGWFGTIGGIGRVLGPIWAAAAFALDDKSKFFTQLNIAYVGILGLFGLSFFVYIGFYRKLKIVKK